MKHINEQEYKDLVLNSKGVVLLDFFANWCGPCRMLSPVLEEVEKELKIQIFKMDCDEEENIPRQYGVMSIPTVAIFKDGQFVEKFIGYKAKEEIIEIVKKHIN